MEVQAVPGALRERLGPEATIGLLQVLDVAGREWKADVIGIAAERFERRLVEEASGLRVQGAQTDAGLRHEITKAESGLRQELTKVESTLRQEITNVEASLRQGIANLDSNLRQEITKLESTMRGEIADARFSLLKWCFIFWIGQVVTMTAIMGVLLRAG